MQVTQIFSLIRNAINAAPRNAYVAELHLQCLKYMDALDGVSGREFCEGVGLKPAWGTEFVKMRKIAPRLKEAGMNVELI